MSSFGIAEFIISFVLVSILCKTGELLRPIVNPTLRRILYEGSGWVSGVLLCLPEKYIWLVNFVLICMFPIQNAPTLFMHPASVDMFKFNAINLGLFLVWLCDLDPMVYSTVLNYHILCHDMSSISLMLLLVSTPNAKPSWWLSSLLCYITSLLYPFDCYQAILMTVLHNVLYSKLKIRPFEVEIKLFGNVYKFVHTSE